MIEVVDIALGKDGTLHSTFGRPVTLCMSSVADYEASWCTLRWQATYVGDLDDWRVYRIESGTVRFHRGVRLAGKCPTCGRKLSRTKEQKEQPCPTT